MRGLQRGLLVGLGVALAAVVAVGYASVYLGIAQPPGGVVSILTVPPAGTVAAATLDDGMPVFVTRVEGEPVVLDARAPHVDGEPDRLVAWCVEVGFFLDPIHGGSFAASGEVLGASADAGMRRLEVMPRDGGARVAITTGSSVAGGAPADTVALDCVPGSEWVVHVPSGDVVFDPSVAADQEPEGWVWVEGRLEAVADAVRLCDGMSGPCATYAEVNGIDPAAVAATRGLFLARVQDDALRDLVIVPDIANTGGPS